MKEITQIIVAALAIFILIGISDTSNEVPLQKDKDSILEDKIEGGSGESTDLEKREVLVERIVDGDTLIVKYFENSIKKEERIRLLLIDTPESVHPSNKVEKFGPESSEFAKEILKEGRRVTLEIGSPERDHYNRMLGYIWVDGKNFNEIMIEKGYARVAYVYPPNTKYLEEFREAEKVAKKNKLGIWSIPGYVTDKGFDMSVIKD